MFVTILFVCVCVCVCSFHYPRASRQLRRLAAGVAHTTSLPLSTSPPTHPSHPSCRSHPTHPLTHPPHPPHLTTCPSARAHARVRGMRTCVACTERAPKANEMKTAILASPLSPQKPVEACRKKHGVCDAFCAQRRQPRFRRNPARLIANMLAMSTFSRVGTMQGMQEMQQARMLVMQER